MLRYLQNISPFIYQLDAVLISFIRALSCLKARIFRGALNIICVCSTFIIWKSALESKFVVVMVVVITARI